jgi:hypothetical protein
MYDASRKQKALEFAEAEANHAGRWNDVSLALSRVGKKCDLHLSRFVRLVFDMTKGGTSGELVKSIRALSERPAWLCCSERKVGSTIELAEKLGFVQVTHRRAYSGSQQENAYTMNWAGIRSITGGTNHPATGSTWCAPPSTTCQGASTTRQAPSTTRNHTKEKKLSGSSLEEDSVSGPGADPNPSFSGNDSDGMDAAAADRDAAGSHAGIGGDEERGLSALLCRQSPLLAEARERRLVPLPADELLHGVYAPIESKHLRNPLSLVAWHRKQLSTVRHPMGDTEADLLIVIAVALYAVSVPDADVRKTRVAIFVNAIHRRKWCKALPFVPKARSLLDMAIKRFGPDWADQLTPIWDRLQVSKNGDGGSGAGSPPDQSSNPQPRLPQSKLSEDDLRHRRAEVRRELEAEWTRVLKAEKAEAAT